jgi:hypothetical protein
MAIDKDTAIAVGDSGTTLYINAGTVTAQNSGTGSSLLGVAKGDGTHANSVGSQCVVRGTSNTGTTWVGQNVPPGCVSGGTALRSLDLTSKDKGWAAGDGGTILKTTSAAQGVSGNWLPSTVATSQALRGISMTSDTAGWAVGNGGTVVKTTDGSTWAAEASGVTADLSGVAFADATHGWATSNDGDILFRGIPIFSGVAQTSNATFPVATPICPGTGTLEVSMSWSDDTTERAATYLYSDSANTLTRVTCNRPLGSEPSDPFTADGTITLAHQYTAEPSVECLPAGTCDDDTQGVRLSVLSSETAAGDPKGFHFTVQAWKRER